MDNNSFFPLKYRLRKTDEPVEIVAWETAVKGARSDTDWVSYIDSHGNEHITEHLTLEWDFIAENPFSSGFLSDALNKMDPWEARMYEMVKEMVIEKEWTVKNALSVAEEIIVALRKSSEVIEGVQKKALAPLSTIILAQKVIDYARKIL